MKKSKNKRVIPGFGLSFGITITMLGCDRIEEGGKKL